MDVVIDTVFEDASVSLKGGRYRLGPARQIAMAAAMPASDIPDARVVGAFIEPLCDLNTVDLDALFTTLGDTPRPTGYRHFRLFDGATGEEWHACFVYEDGVSLTRRDVLFGALNHPTLQLSAWKRTDWLPDMIPGVLDLEIAFEARPRTRLSASGPDDAPSSRTLNPVHIIEIDLALSTDHSPVA